MSLLLANRALIKVSGVVSNNILITMTPTASFLVGINLTFASGTLTIDWKDGSSTENFVSGVELTHTYVIASTYIAEISGDLANITKFIADNSKITFISGLATGLLIDLRLFNNPYVGVLSLINAPVSVSFQVHTMSGLTEILFATSGNSALSFCDIKNNNITGVLHLENNPVGAFFNASGNALMTNIIFSTTGNSKVGILNLSNCGLTGTLNLVNLPIGGFNLLNATSLDAIIFESTVNTTAVTSSLSNSNVQVLDLTTIPLAGNFQIYNNSILDTLTFATANNGLFGAFSWLYGNNLNYIDLTGFSFAANNGHLRIEDNSMIVDDVNHILVDLYSLVSGEGVGGDYTSRVINIAGTNAAPDGSSGGFDGLTAKTNLQGKGFTVTTN